MIPYQVVVDSHEHYFGPESKSEDDSVLTAPAFVQAKVSIKKSSTTNVLRSADDDLEKQIALLVGAHTWGGSFSAENLLKEVYLSIPLTERSKKYIEYDPFVEIFATNDYLGESELRNLGTHYAIKLGSSHEEQESSQGVPRYLLQLYALEEAGKHREAAKLIFEFIESNFASLSLDKINSLIEMISLERLSEWSIVGIVRSTYRARHVLGLWKNLYQNARRELHSKGHDANKLLIGIQEQSGG